MKLEKAKKIADKYLELLKPYCQRIKIAGSIRREVPEVKDIELVCVPKDIVGFSSVVNKLEKVKGSPTGKYTQRILPEGIKLDLFMASKENLGNIFLIRTGSWQFSKWIMGTKVREAGLQQKDGFLWRGSEKINCLEEKDLFDLIGVPYVEPRLRSMRNE